MLQPAATAAQWLHGAGVMQRATQPATITFALITN